MSHDPFIIGLDIGTTGCKAVAVTSVGDILAAGRGEYPLTTTPDGRAEQRPDALWDGITHALQSLAKQTGTSRAAGVAISAAMHTLLAVDADGRPLSDAMTYADGRAAPCVDQLAQHVNLDALYRRTGCPLQATYDLPRLAWWRQHRPTIWSRAARWVSLKSWIMWRLTGAWAVDTGLASTTGLLDHTTMQWDRPSLDAIELAAETLPALVEPTAIVGLLREDVAEQTHWPRGLPVVAGGSDGALAHIGAGAADPGERVVTVGTSGAVRMITRQPHVDDRHRTWSYIILPDLWVVGGAINNGGMTLEWIRRQFYSSLPEDEGFTAISRDVAASPPGAHGVMMLPYLTGERSPHYDASLRGVLTGLTLAHTRADIARAAAEGVAFCLADVWDALPPHEQIQDRPVRLTGGAATSPAFSTILANALNVPVQPVDIADASAIGAAIVGHIAMGHIQAAADIDPPLNRGAIVLPDAEHVEVYRQRHEIFKAAIELAR